jgi:hypothetical protein
MCKATFYILGCGHSCTTTKLCSSARFSPTSHTAMRVEPYERASNPQKITYRHERDDHDFDVKNVQGGLCKDCRLPILVESRLTSSTNWGDA